MSTEARLFGRILSLVGLGRVRAATALEGKGIRRLQVQFDEAETRDNTQAMQHYGFASRLKAGADVLVLFVGGDRSRGVAVASNDQRARVELDVGEVCIHDDQGQKVHVSRAGIVIEGAGMPITINGDVVLNGKLTATGDVVAGAISLQQHRHGGVQGGSSQTGAPQ